MKTATHPHRTPPLILRYDFPSRAWLDSEPGSAPYQFVTRLTAAMFEPFDAEATAARLAATSTKPEYAGRTAAEILALWDAKAKASRDLGNYVHAIAEHWPNPPRQPPPRPSPPFTTAEQFPIAATATTTAMQKLSEQFEIVARETLVFSPTSRIAAIADIILRDRASRDLTVADFKTAESIPDDSYNRTALPPFPPIPDSKFDKYALQLNLTSNVIASEGWFNADHATTPAVVATPAIILIRPLDPDPHWIPVPKPLDIIKQVVAAPRKIIEIRA